MAAVVETVQTYPDMMVKLGMATPAARAFTAGSFVATVAYLSGFPSGAFQSGQLKPLRAAGGGVGAGAQFLYLPLGVAAAAYLFTGNGDERRVPEGEGDKYEAMAYRAGH